MIDNLKKRLNRAKGNWPEELPGILWAMRTNEKTSTGETPFSLAFGMDSLVPAEVGEPSLRYAHATEDNNHQTMRVELDLLEEKRELALVRLEAQKRQIEAYLNRKAKFRNFKVGDHVLKASNQTTKEKHAGKLGANWEGPYKIKAVLGKGSYQLENLQGEAEPLNWNVLHLKRYYF